MKERKVVEHKWGHVSFNPLTGGGAETAIVIDGLFYILLGRWDELLTEELTKKKALSIFKANTDQQSIWSNSL